MEEGLFWVTGVNRSASGLIASDGGTKEFELLRQFGVETGRQIPRYMYKVRQCKLQGSVVRGNADPDHFLYSDSA